jgi:S1-C subfamily serine protease
MLLLSWRCFTARFAIFFIAAAVAAAEPAWRAIFPGAEGESAAFAVGDGRHLVAVAFVGATAEAGRLSLDGRELPAEVFVDPVSRLVVFRLSGPPGRALRLLSAAPGGEGTAVRVAGGTGKIRERVKRVDGKILPLALLRVDYAAGAPLPGTPLTDASGAVLAVAHQVTGAKTGYAVPVEVVREVLAGVQSGGRVSKGWIGLRLRPEASSPQVTLVQAGSPAAIAGVKPGDVLLEVAGRRLADYADAVNAFYFLRPGVAATFRIRRGSQDLSLSVTPVVRVGR